MARDAGLKPLADLFVEQPSKGPAPEDAATAYVCDEYPDVTSVIQGPPISLQKQHQKTGRIENICANRSGVMA